MKTFLKFLPVTAFVVTFSSGPVLAESPREENTVKNSGFEAVTVSGEPAKRGWTLNRAEQVPTQWSLSSAFPGELLVVDSEDAEGGRFVRMTAPPARASHIYQACPQIERGKPYEVTLRYQGGPVKLEMYEYGDAGKLVGEHVFAQGDPQPVGDGALADDRAHR